MKDDTQSGKYGDTGLCHRKKKEDRSLKEEESKTKGDMRLETDAGQTVYTRHETITGQTANTSASDSSPSPEEDRRTTQPSLLLKRGLTACLLYTSDAADE